MLPWPRAFFPLALMTLSVEGPAHAGADRRDGFFSGKLIDPATGNTVKGATVKVFRINTDHLLGSDKSGSAGRFRIDGLPAADEELDVRVNGSAVHYETGWVGCNHHVVPVLARRLLVRPRTSDTVQAAAPVGLRPAADRHPIGSHRSRARCRVMSPTSVIRSGSTSRIRPSTCSRAGSGSSR